VCANLQEPPSLAAGATTIFVNLANASWQAIESEGCTLSFFGALIV
jgi:hypothetical protein